MLNQGCNHDVGVERPNDLHADELERDGALGEVFEGTDRRFRSQPAVAGRTGLSLRLSDHVLSRRELQSHLACDTARRRALVGEPGETEPLSSSYDSSGVGRACSASHAIWGHRRHLVVNMVSRDTTRHHRSWLKTTRGTKRHSGPLSREGASLIFASMKSFATLFAVMLVTLAQAVCTLGAQASTPITGRTDGELAGRLALDIAAVPGAEVAVSIRDLASPFTLDLNASMDFHAASTMKIPVMLEVLRAVDERRLSLEQPILLINRFHSIADGSPYSLDARDDSDSSMYGNIGKRVPVRSLLERMIVRSSNLATNELIALVGADRANETAHRLGATHVRVLRGVEDGKAYEAGMNNTTTSADLAVLLEHIERGDALRPESGKLMKEILLRQEFNDEIPAGLPAGTRVAHKTGSITATLHDAAIVYPPGRSAYVLVVLTRRITDEKVAQQLIARISRDVWDFLQRRDGDALGGQSR